MKSPLGLLSFFGGAGLLAMTPSAQAVQIYYQEGFSPHIYIFDTVAGTNTLLGATGGPTDSFGLAFAPGGALYAHDRGTASLYTLNTTTGAATLVGSSGLGAEDFTFNLTGSTGYVTSDDNLYAIDPATGAATLLGALGTTMDGLATAPVALTVNGTNYAAGAVFGIDSGALYAIDVVTQAATFIGTVDADETIDFGPDGMLYGHVGNTFYAIDPATLTGTALGTSGNVVSVFGMAIQPEVQRVADGGQALLLAGLAWFGLHLVRRRR